MFDVHATYVVELTPAGRGAVAVVLVAGAAGVQAVDECFTAASGQPLAAAPIGRIVLGRWDGPAGEELIVCRRSAAEIEIHCHGGDAAVRAVVNRLIEHGCVSLSWRDWLRQSRGRVSPTIAFASAAADATTCAAHIALADATTARAAAVLLDQFDGALSAAVRDACAAVTASNWSDAAGIIDEILSFREVGLHLTTLWRVVLTGPPNVGKSSLLNAIAGYQRAIVSPQPGTTRDVVTLETAIDGWPVQFADTAGVRHGEPEALAPGAGPDKLESAGIALTHATLAEADLAVIVEDATRPTGPPPKRLAAARMIHVLNKIDLLAAPTEAARPPGVIATSAVTGQGIVELLAAIARALVPAAPPAGAPVPFTAEQVTALEAARIAVDARDALAAVAALRALLADESGAGGATSSRQKRVANERG